MKINLKDNQKSFSHFFLLTLFNVYVVRCGVKTLKTTKERKPQAIVERKNFYFSLSLSLTKISFDV